MTYDALREFSATFGLIFLVVMFLSVVGYALWPSNKNRFKEASKLPFDDDYLPLDEKGEAHHG